MSKLPSVLMLSPVYESVYGPARDAAVNFAAHYVKQGGYTKIVSSWRSSSLPESRTLLSEHALTTDFEMILWVDSDNVYSPEQAALIVKRAHERKTIVGGLYRSRHEKMRYVCEVKEEMRFGELISAYWTGFGLTAMPMAVLRIMYEKYGKDMFRTIDNSELGTVIPKHLDIAHGDDVSFCRHWLMLGQSVYVDTSVRIGHIGPTIFSIE